MSLYEKGIIRQRKWMLYLLSLIVLGAGFSPYPRFFCGLLLGSTVSFYNLWLLQRNIRRLGEIAATEGKRKFSIGSISRFAGAAFAALMALRFEEYFHIVGVVIGLSTSYLIIIADVVTRILSREGNF